MNRRNKRSASLSLDLDNQWSYLKTHGDKGWESFPSYLDLVVPRFLRFLAERKLTITVFVVGQDAALGKNWAALRAIADAGHEIGNHSFRHEPWFHLYSEEEIERELAAAEEEIARATGRRPVGFRGPGYSLSSATLSALHRRGYAYDATTLPTFLGPIARAYYFMTARLDEAEKRRRSRLFGGLREGLRPVKPYRWRLDSGSLIELPVTTFPILRVPIHVSYLLYLSVVSPAVARHYFKMALRMCQAAGIQPSILLHPLDFLGMEDVPDLSFFPAMQIPAAEKIERVGQYVDDFCSLFDVLTLRDHVSEIERTAHLPAVEPHFPLAGQTLGQATIAQVD